MVILDILYIGAKVLQGSSRANNPWRLEAFSPNDEARKETLRGTWFSAGVWANGLREINHEMRQQKGGRTTISKERRQLPRPGHCEKEKGETAARRLTMMHD